MQKNLSRKFNLGVLFYLIISIIIFVHTVYKHVFIWGGDKFDYYFQYYLLSFFLFIFTIIYFFLKKKIKIYLNVIVFSIIFSAYLVEIYLSNFNYKYTFGHLNEIIKIYNDNIKNKKVSIVTSPRSLYKNYNSEILPLGGVANVKTIFCNENGYMAHYQSDRYGFNNPDFVWDDKKISYLILGDSFAHGACVNRPNDIASVLRTKLNKKAINLGFAGNGPLTSLAAYREYGKNNDFENVLLFYYEGNDLINLGVELRHEVLSKYYNDKSFSQSLKDKQNKINSLGSNNINIILKYIENKKNRKIIDIIKLNSLRNLIQIKKINYKDYYSKEQNINFNELEQILLDFKLETFQNESNFILIYLPSSETFIKKNDNRKNYERLVKIVNKHEINFIDFRNLFIQKKPLEYFSKKNGNFGHYNISGYEFIARKILNEN